MTGSFEFRALGVDCRIVGADESALPDAGDLAVTWLLDLDATASRFRADSEVARLAAMSSPHRTITAPATPLLRSLIQDALWAADVTGGLVDPTLGRAMEANGYDADLDDILSRQVDESVSAGKKFTTTPSTLRDLSLDPAAGTVTFATGTLIDLGATGKATAADRLAADLAAEQAGGFLVDLGGDVAVAGEPPTGGWVIATDDAPAENARITVTSHGVATSGIDRRRWQVGGATRHHLLDPTTGRPVARTWWRVTCVAASALEANTATTAAIVLGDAAVAWLTTRGIPARLVSEQGEVHFTPGWPRVFLGERAS
ncbi:FAD:protein FMN transferase [Flexivirga endophytica]|uniref:FAD:protein FMN transferase n=1 Tax=Flexivirga endophytica TaxID=1849103 RepID=A0A916WW80_9MICO|nr:FAD:protein FMN transferase [Flexivirga endophytica]GGB34799.1 FAD:protein FMN transferase [Flexivirga endophytica]GHB42699.1 FAD:protein FMN transferase [Flexivirga endophytica]